MRIGIIDFGTNTLRLDIFETEDTGYRNIFDYAIYSRIVENTVGTSLSQDGIEHVIQSIEEHQAICRHYRCTRVECFSTASLRYIDNAASVLEQVEFRTGIHIRCISGDEEAHYDFLALRSVSESKSGVGCDLGGGSIQVFTFDENGPVKSASFPLGSSRVAKEFSVGAIPTEKEIAAIEEKLRSSLAEAGFLPGQKRLFAMGGTAKTASALRQRALQKGGSIPFEELETMLGVLSAEPEESLELIEDIEPKRSRTLVPGMAVLAGVMRFFGCEEMEVFGVGVREGFLESLLNGGEPETPNILDVILGSLS